MGGFGAHPLAGTALGASSTFGGLGSLTSAIQPPKPSQSGNTLLSGSNGIQASSGFSGGGIGSSSFSTQTSFIHQLQQGSASQSKRLA